MLEDQQNDRGVERIDRAVKGMIVVCERLIERCRDVGVKETAVQDSCNIQMDGIGLERADGGGKK